jgi:TfoX/Sxy family transcriptional regulator of competence genes
VTAAQIVCGASPGELHPQLDEPDREKLRTEQGAVHFEPMPGRRMREYVVLPGAILSDTKKLKRWLLRSIDYTADLPRKPKSPKRARKASG